MEPHTRDAWQALLLFLAFAAIVAIATLADIIIGARP
jgi:hypothetical protein